MPKHLHLVHNPRTQRRVARRIVNNRRTLIKLITTLKGLFHLAHRKLHNQQMKKSASFPNKPSTETQSGVKAALRS